MADAPVHLKCLLCGHKSSVDEGAFLEQSAYVCGGCGHVFDLESDDEDDDDLEIEFTSPLRRYEIYCYLAPMLVCECRAWIELPYSNLPQVADDGKILVKGEDPPELPSEGWSATFGCRRCGKVSAYVASQVEALPIRKLTEGSYQSGKGVFAAEFPCGDRRCTVRSSIHVDIGDGNASAVVALLRSGLFDETLLPCGHKMKTVPEKFYRVEPVLRRMW